MKNLTKAILDTLLPYKWPRLVAGSTISLITGILALSEWGQKIGLSLTPTEISRIRREGIPWLCVVALALIHYLVVREKNSTFILQPWKLHEKVTLGLGDYYDVMTKNGEKFFRISLKEISQQTMPSAYVFNPQPVETITEVATIGFDPGFFINHGSCVKQITLGHIQNEDCFYMSKDSFHEEKSSVYFFKTESVTDGGHFFRCFVDHINPSKNEIELNVFLIWLNK